MHRFWTAQSILKSECNIVCSWSNCGCWHASRENQDNQQAYHHGFGLHLYLFINRLPNYCLYSLCCKISLCGVLYSISCIIAYGQHYTPIVITMVICLPCLPVFQSHT